MDRISSLMDGELDAHQAEQAYARLKNDPDARACWDVFHLIGDVLRSEGAVSAQLDARLKARLAAEPTVLAPRRSPAKRVAAYAWSAAASLAAVAVVGWVTFYSPLAPQQQIAVAPAPVAAVPAPSAVVPPDPLASVPSDGKMNEYLIAHQEYSPSTAIQGLAPYIRSVSATPAARGRE